MCLNSWQPLQFFVRRDTMKSLLSLLFFVALATLGLGLVCPTCQNEDCKQSDIPKKECAFNHPYNIPILVVRSAKSYQCLHIEIFLGKTWQQISQCVFVSSDICTTLKQSYNVTVCTMKPPQTVGKVPASSEIDVSMPTISSEEKPDDSTAGSVTHHVSIIFFISVCAWWI